MTFENISKNNKDYQSKVEFEYGSPKKIADTEIIKKEY